jgi:hypothetical protein
MDGRSILLLFVVWGSATPAQAIDWWMVHRHRTRPECLIGIPDSRYQYLPRSRSEMVVSRTAVLLRNRTMEIDSLLESPLRPMSRWPESAGEVETTPRLVSAGRAISRRSIIDLYQLDQPGLRIDHCEISQVALQIHDDGTWVISLRADQNRGPEEGEPAEWNPRLHIKRNEFTVRLRCLGAFQNAPAEAAPIAGRPLLADLNPPPFWVENGEPRHVRWEGRNVLVEKHFADIDRVEIELYYR